MGTNYYARLDECPHCKHGSEDIHIGKSSAGWEFLFAPNRERNITTAAGWWEFLKDVPIYDEYGQVVSLEALKDIVACKTDGLNAQTATYQQYASSFEERNKHEFRSLDGYRFSTYEDFF